MTTTPPHALVEQITARRNSTFVFETNTLNDVISAAKTLLDDARLIQNSDDFLAYTPPSINEPWIDRLDDIEPGLKESVIGNIDIVNDILEQNRVTYAKLVDRLVQLIDNPDSILKHDGLDATMLLESEMTLRDVKEIDQNFRGPIARALDVVNDAREQLHPEGSLHYLQVLVPGRKTWLAEQRTRAESEDLLEV